MVRLLLIPQASLKVLPTTWVYFYLSLPAKSTKFSLLTLIVLTPFLIYLLSKIRVKTAWDLLDSLFIYVNDTCLFLLPILSKCIPCSASSIISSVIPSTYIPRWSDSLICSPPLLLLLVLDLIVVLFMRVEKSWLEVLREGCGCCDYY